jgi:hypothetical protein
VAKEVKFPNIKVKLTGADGNAFAIIGLVTKAMRAGGIGAEDRKEFMDEAMGGDYDHLLQTCMKTVNVS